MSTYESRGCLGLGQAVQGTGFLGLKGLRLDGLSAGLEAERALSAPLEATR